jgi:hypothetical protein
MMLSLLVFIVVPSLSPYRHEHGGVQVEAKIHELDLSQYSDGIEASTLTSGSSSRPQTEAPTSQPFIQNTWAVQQRGLGRIE